MNIARKLLIALTAVLTLSVAGSALAVSSVDYNLLTRSDIGGSTDGVLPGERVIQYEHVFDPGPTLELSDVTVDSVWLYVGLAQWSCGSTSACAEDLLFEADQVETAALDLTGVAWDSGRATLQLLWGDVTAEADLLANAGILNVTVSVSEGDLAVLASNMVTQYSWEPTGGSGARDRAA
jgi:hypothetical protein